MASRLRKQDPTANKTVNGPKNAVATLSNRGTRSTKLLGSKSLSEVIWPMILLDCEGSFNVSMIVRNYEITNSHFRDMGKQ